MRVTAALTLATLSMTVSGQVVQKEQPPTFKSGTDLLTVQAAVVDKDGRPVTDLQPADFSVSVGGKARKVSFARFYGSAGTSVLGATPGAVTDPAPRQPPVADAGRLVMFVIDPETIKSGSEKALFDSGAMILNALSAADAAGLVTIPSGGVKPTREHQRVLNALRNVNGTMPAMPWRWYITWSEAEGIDRSSRVSVLRPASSNGSRPRSRTSTSSGSTSKRAMVTRIRANSKSR